MRLTWMTGLSMCLFCAALATGCGSDITAVESGEYEGTIAKVEVEEKEIYVDLDDERTLELYFSEETELVRDGDPVTFDVLEAGQAVSVEVEREGNRMDPVRVEILP